MRMTVTTSEMFGIDPQAVATLLFRLARTMNAATTYQEVLDAVAELLPDCDGVSLDFWENMTHEGATYIEMIAAAKLPEHRQGIIGTRFPVSTFSIIDPFANERAVVVENVENDERLDAMSKQSYLTFNTRAFFAIPLFHHNQFCGNLFFNYAQPRQFDQQERQLVIGISDLVQAAVERILSQLETERARESAITLFRLADKMNSATTFQDVLDSVAELLPDCDGIYLNLFEDLNYETATYYEVAAIANIPEPAPFPVGTHVPFSTFTLSRRLLKRRSLIVEDVEKDEQIDSGSLSWYQRLNTRAFFAIRFFDQERFFGSLVANYQAPRTFSQAERQLVLGIGDLVLAAVKRIISQRETEQAEEAATTLFAMAEMLNAAMTYQEVLDTIAQLLPDSNGLYLNLFENLNYFDATYYEVVAVANASDDLFPIGARVVLSSFPIARDVLLERWMAVEDVATDSRIDDASREWYAENNTCAFIAIRFFDQNRFFGSLFVNYMQPRTFSQAERQLILGIGDLVLAAVKRILSQIETQEAEAAATRLYRLADNMNAATDYQEIMNAVAKLLPDCDGVYLNLWENLNAEGATYMEMAAGANVPEHLRYLVGGRIPIDMFPIANYYNRARSWAVEDIDQVDLIDPVSRETWRQLGTRAFLNVAFANGDRYIGGIFFNYMNPRQFSKDDRDLALGISDMVLAAVNRIIFQKEIESGRKGAERLAAATALLAQSKDEQCILNAIIKAIAPHATHRAALSYPVMSTEVPGRLLGFRLVAAHYAEEGFVSPDALPNVFYRVDDFPMLRMAVDQPDHIVYMEDALHDTRPEIQARQDLAASTGWVATIAIPLSSGELWHGIVTLMWKEAQHFSDDMQTLLGALQPVITSVVHARRAYLAAEAAREETEQRVRELQTVAAVSAAAVTVVDEARLVNALIQLVQASFQPHQISLYLLAENALVARSDVADAQLARLSLGSDSLIAKAARTQKVQIDKHMTATHVPVEQGKGTMVGHAQIAELAAPMVVSNQVVGVLSVRAPQGVTFGDSEVRVISTLADLIGVAVHNVRYYHQAQELAALEERTRLARELHDSVSQALYGIGLGAQTAHALWERDPAIVKESLDYILSLSQAALVEMRALIFELRPESLENEGLTTALAKQGASLQTRHGLDVRLELCDEPTLSLNTKESLYRIAREALHNIVKHAGATQVTLRLSCEGGELLLEVIDNGVGFSSDQDFPGHLGLQSMRERVAQLGGTFHINSAAGEGTHLTARLWVRESS